MSLNVSQYTFLRKRHIKYFQRILQVIPSRASNFDTSRMTVLFFALSGLDVLGALDETVDPKFSIEIIEWIYSLQICSSKGAQIEGGFKGGSSLTLEHIDKIDEVSSLIKELDVGHITMTYTALASLLILGDDLSRIDRKAINNHIRALQCPDGSFLSTTGGSENDMRFVYSAATICYILQDFSALNIDDAVKYIMSSLTYEGGFGQGSSLEAHGGSTYCALAALYLMDKLDVLSRTQKENILRWLILRQDTTEGGFSGRPNKVADTCYAFWVGASLAILNGLQYIDQYPLVQFVLATQDPIIGGLGKQEGSEPDGLHSYLGICGLSLIPCESTHLGLIPIDPALNVSLRAFKHLKDLHKKWLSDS